MMIMAVKWAIAYSLNNTNLVITRFEARTLFYAKVSYAFVRSGEDTGDIREAKELGNSSWKRSEVRMTG